MRLSTLGLVSTSVIAAASTLASADTVNAFFTGVGPGEPVSVVLNGTPTNTTAGAFNWNRDLGNPGSLPGFSPTFITFCIDLTQFISNGGPYAYETFPTFAAPTSGAGGAGGMGPVRAALMGRLFADHFNSLTSADQYAGFQLAVWEIALDGDLSLVTGNFTGTGTPAAVANATLYLATITLSGPSWPVFAIDDPIGSNTQLQGQIMAPTPGAAALMGLGGLALGRRRRA